MASVSALLSAGRTFSFEFFPPHSDAEQARLTRTIHELEPLEPSFVSVTYRGGPAARRRTFDVVTAMLHLSTLEPMAHLTCVGHSRLELAETLVEYRRSGIENLMALGGDPPKAPEDQRGELRHAIELVELARAIGGFSIGVAAHPAGHPSARGLATDRARLAEKLTVADFAITQFFFDATLYDSLMDDLARRQISKPVVPGVMPVTSLSSIPRMATMGAPVPDAMRERLERAERLGGEAAVRAEGIEIATALCRDLLHAGAPGLHFYTLNRSSATREIHAALGLGAGPGAGSAAGPGAGPAAGSLGSTQERARAGAAELAAPVPQP